jgi:hypothetical protein
VNPPSKTVTKRIIWVTVAIIPFNSEPNVLITRLVATKVIILASNDRPCANILYMLFIVLPVVT